MFRLIDYRYTSRKVTIFTSNAPIDMLKLNERIADRVFRMCIRLKLPEESIRAIHADAENMEFMNFAAYKEIHDAHDFLIKKRQDEIAERVAAEYMRLLKRLWIGRQSH